MKSNKQNIQETIAAVLVFLYLYTGLSKYYSINVFQVVLNKSILLKPYSIFLSLTLPGFELLLVLLLAIPITRRIGFNISAYLLSLFTIYLLYMIKFSPTLPCSCGGIISQLSWTQHILLNILLIVLSIYGSILTKKIKLEKYPSAVLKSSINAQ